MITEGWKAESNAKQPHGFEHVISKNLFSLGLITLSLSFVVQQQFISNFSKVFHDIKSLKMHLCGKITFSVLFIKQQQASNFSAVHFHDNLWQVWHPISSITCMFNKEQGDCYSATHHRFYFILSEVILEILDCFRSLLISFRNFRFIILWFSFRVFLIKPLDLFSQLFHCNITDKLYTDGLLEQRTLLTICNFKF